MTTPLSLNPKQVVRLTRASVAQAPGEACGILLGRVVDDERRVLRLTVSANLASATNHFLVDPVHLMRQEEASRTDGLKILGVWHSHPAQEACPSHLDFEGTPDGWVQLIARVDDGVLTDLRAWDSVDGEAVEAKVYMDVGTSKDAAERALDPMLRLARWGASRGPLEA